MLKKQGHKNSWSKPSKTLFDIVSEDSWNDPCSSFPNTLQWNQAETPAFPPAFPSQLFGQGVPAKAVKNIEMVGKKASERIM